MGIVELLKMYVGNEIKLIYKDLTYVVGVLHMVGFDFYVDKIRVDVDNVKGWDLTKY